MSFQEYSNSIRSKLKIGNINQKLVLGLVLFAIASLAFSVYTIFTTSDAYPDNVGEIQINDADNALANDEGENNDVSDSPTKQIYVHVAGCVKSAGVYCITEGARIDDAIKAAGGFTKSADQTSINLAEVISDGQQIIVPKKVKATSNSSDASASSNSAQSAPQGNSGASNGLVNINSATSEQLQTLRGIGEAKAKKIIDYREQSGPFSSIEELTNVSGIGEKTLESIRSYICI